MCHLHRINNLLKIHKTHKFYFYIHLKFEIPKCSFLHWFTSMPAPSLDAKSVLFGFQKSSEDCDLHVQRNLLIRLFDDKWSQFPFAPFEWCYKQRNQTIADTKTFVSRSMVYRSPCWRNSSCSLLSSCSLAVTFPQDCFILKDDAGGFCAMHMDFMYSFKRIQ